jgi:hypothetical protein
MEQFKTRVIINKKEKTKLTKLPQTPFVIKDNESMENDYYIVARNGSYFTYVRLEDGELTNDIGDPQHVVLDRINKGKDTIVTSELILSL